MDRHYPILEAEKLASFYERHLYEVILPFWLSRSVDEEFGGFFTCFDNTGERLVSQDKYTWSQGRMVWVLSKLSEMGGVPGIDKRCASLARRGAEFLMGHCLLGNGNCTFIMERDGSAKPPREGGDCDISIYADCFVVLGLSKYASICGDSMALDFAYRLYRSIIRRIDCSEYRSEPYPVPKGWRMHGIPMILLNISTELANTLEAAGDDRHAMVNERAETCMNDIMSNFARGSGVVREMIGQDNLPREDMLMGRYVAPGHTMECMWFAMLQAMKSQNPVIIRRAAEIIAEALEIGWDSEYGGILLFTDRDGGMPHGSVQGMQNERMVKKVLSDWDNKLWWTHAEALYSLLLAYSLTGKEALMDGYRKVFDYTFRIFPSLDQSIGEWIQIRDRLGRPEQKIVALPVKDPFHITRSLMLMIEMLRQ